MVQLSHVLKINVNSATNLAPVCRSMSTYAVGWVNPERKQTTRVDHTGNTSPVWNDEFIFPVTPDFLKSETTTFEIEIYAQAWLRDLIVGSVKVSIVSLVPTPNPKATARRAVALQIRRPSGRPQGILNVGVSIIDGTMKSMPLDGPTEEPTPGPDSSRPELRRVKSERSWMVSDDENHHGGSKQGPEIGQGTPVGMSACNSDIGPSPSVVAAAMANGLYVPLMGKVGALGGVSNNVNGGKQNEDADSSIIEWADQKNDEDVMTKIERWKTELNEPATQGKEKASNGSTTRRKRRYRRTQTEVGRLFRCFGKAYGIEFTIVCGGSQIAKRAKANGKNKPLPISDDD